MTQLFGLMSLMLALRELITLTQVWEKSQSVWIALRPKPVTRREWVMFHSFLYAQLGSSVLELQVPHIHTVILLCRVLVLQATFAQQEQEHYLILKSVPLELIQTKFAPFQMLTVYLAHQDGCA